MHKFLDLLKRFRRDERGAFLAMFGVMAVVLIATAGATVDFTSVQNARTRAQVALDAAALALQPKIYATTYANEAAMEADIKTLANAFLLDRLAGTTYTAAAVTVADANKALGTLTLTSSLTTPLYFVSLIGISEMSMTMVAQATKGSQDLEVAVALDVTGSMDDDDKIEALIDAANDMVDIIVQTQQTPTYTKMALVPWSAGVNVGADVAAARGTPVGAKGLTAAAWQSGTTDNVNNGGITRASPGKVTTSGAHGLVTDDVVWISGLSNASSSSGWTSLNNKKYTVTWVSNTEFTLGVATNGWGFSGTSTGGTVKKCLNDDCEIIVTTGTDHGLVDNDYVFFTDVGGMTQLNSDDDDIDDEDPDYYTVAEATATTFALDGTLGPGSSPTFSAYTSGGSAWCVKYGCQYLRFTPQTSGWGTPDPRLAEVSTDCVTERTISPYQYTDAAPATAYVGMMYPPGSNTCPDLEIVPLTSDKDLLHDTIDDLEANGSTGGQIGTAWAWYMLAPNFKSLWPTASQPADYLTPNLIKVVVLMTDGSLFNSVYCNGVIAADSTSGSGNTDDHISCNATNGDPFTQTKAICDEMKDPSTGIIVYTVGFDISDQSDEKDMLEHCASEPKADHYKLADNAAQLSQAFADIAQDIAQLRLSE